MADAFKAGDVVVLKSGGPKMTVTSVGDHYGVETAWTVWFIKDEEKNGSFAVAALKTADW